MIFMISLTKPLEQTFCFGICFDGIDTITEYSILCSSVSIFTDQIFPVDNTMHY